MPTFTIREHKSDDIEEFYEAVVESREHVAPWMSWLTPDFSRDTLACWIDECAANRLTGESFEFLIIDENGGSIAGACGLNSINELDKRCNLGYWVRRTRLGEGAALTAVELLRDFGFQTLKLNRIEIVVAKGNKPSLRVARASGAIDEGIQAASLNIHGMAHDARMFALINPDAVRVG